MSKAVSRKNILLIFTDQQRADTIGAGGNEYIQTPALDALYSDSVVFQRCMTPSPVCVPARNCLMHGVYPNRAGCNDNDNTVPYSGRSLYGILTENGYDTMGIGKMHFAHDGDGLHGFASRLIQEEMPGKNDDYLAWLKENCSDTVFDYNGHRSEMYYIPQISQLPARLHPSQWVGDRSVEFLQKRSGDKPFFLMASFIHPHPPFSPPAPWNKLYRNTLPSPFVPESNSELTSYHNRLQNQYKGLTVGIDMHLMAQMKAFYYACISFVDYQIGRIVAELKRLGIYDDTMIIFTSDHGEMLGDYNCLGKRSMLDCACRVPLMIKCGSCECRNEPASLCDIAPTVLSYAGIDYDKAEFDGEDLLCKHGREFVFSQYSNGDTGLYMIASATDKLIYSAADRKYWYFSSFPESENTYSPNDPRCVQLSALLDRYIARDTAPNRSVDVKSKEEAFANAPFLPLRQDNGRLKAQELAAIPDGYKIYL